MPKKIDTFHEDIQPFIIEMSPFDALAIFHFLKAFDYSPRALHALGSAVKRFEHQICDQMTPERLDDAHNERELYKLLRLEPNEKL